ncbi:MAG TPA: amidohydrolase [Desulfosarcina sp.]|nr:amidohydrolase [Desulfosarcina sp.]
MKDLSIALVQSDLAWEDPAANLKRFKAHIDGIADKVHLIVLPEMFSTGFSMRPERLAQSMDGPGVAWLQERSHKTGADIAGSLIIEENGAYFNRLIWAKPDGTLAHYDKKHLFRYAGEEKVYTPGNRQLLVDCHGWKFRPFICYDLRFPVWTRNLDNCYDAALFVANWPERRAPHWSALLRARAIENQCYVAGVNRVGVDGSGHRYRGDTALIDPMGRVVAAKSNQEAVVSAVLSAKTLTRYRRSFPAWMDADGDLLK